MGSAHGRAVHLASGSPPETAGDIVLRFTSSGSGTRLLLTHSGWERFGEKAVRAARGYRLGWEYVLRIHAGRRGVLVNALDVIGWILSTVQRAKGARSTGGVAQPGK